MNAYISTELNMVRANDQKRYELSMDIEAFLGMGGTIEVLEGPSFKPPPMRHEPPAAIEAKPSRARREEEKPAFVDKMTLREIERAERQAMAAQDRANLVVKIKKYAETMTYREVSDRTGLSRRMLYCMAKDHGFSFKRAAFRDGGSQARCVIDEAYDVSAAERIKAFQELGLSRNQAIDKLGVTFRTFNRILAKFGIDYPKRTKGPAPAFFDKPAQ